MIYAINGLLQIKKDSTYFFLLLMAVKTLFIKLYDAVSVESLGQNRNCSFVRIS
jgi:hypothetical protein